MTLSHQEAEAIVAGLSERFNLPMPQINYVPDRQMSIMHYWAFCYPQLNEIYFRQNEIPDETPTHEFFHLLHYQSTGDITDEHRSEGIAQWAGSLWLLNGPELLDFQCQVCGNPQPQLSFNATDGSFICNQCGAVYDWMPS